MPFDPESGLHLFAPDHELNKRQNLLSELGLGPADEELDAFATRLARDFDLPYAMVNLITDRQFFAGLHNPTDGKLPVVDRSMPRYHGYCPEVLANKVARILPDVFAKPRFASNPVVDLIGIRSYAGAPLIHEGTVIGTLCALGPITRPKTVGQAWLSLMRARRDELMDLIYRRNGRAQQ